MTENEIIAIIGFLGIAVTAVFGAVGVYLNSRVQKQKNIIDTQAAAADEHQQQLASQKVEQERQAEIIARLDAQAKERAEQRRLEREQDRLDRESELQQMRNNRESDQQLMGFLRDQVIKALSEVNDLRTENTTLAKQVFELIRRNDNIQRDFEISEKDRVERSQALDKANIALMAANDQLNVATQKIISLELEIKAQHEAHERELKHVNDVSNLKLDLLQTRMDEINNNYVKQIEQWQRSEIPRNLEVTHLRYALRESYKLLTPENIDSVSKQLMEQGLSYDSLLYPKVDPLLVTLGRTKDNGSGEADPATSAVASADGAGSTNGSPVPAAAG